MSKGRATTICNDMPRKIPMFHFELGVKIVCARYTIELGGSLPLAFENQQGHICVALLTPRTARGDLPPKSAVQPAAVPVLRSFAPGS